MGYHPLDEYVLHSVRFCGRVFVKSVCKDLCLRVCLHVDICVCALICVSLRDLMLCIRNSVFSD